jgi:cyclohexanone monooxygenase
MPFGPNSNPTPGAAPLDAIVVGAGFAGLYMSYRLREAGFSALVLEAGSDLGGTWYWNCYPGARCDVPSLEYSYSFSEELQQEWNWRERFATQPEILAYIRRVADKFDLRRNIRFDTRVVSARFDQADALWTLKTHTGDEWRAHFCIMATGCISEARLPDIAGVESFQGPIYHTGHWPQQGVELAGKRVALIGTGSSGVQAIPCIAREAAHLTVFQRTPCYSVPARNAPLAAEFVAEWKSNYAAKRAAARVSRVGVLHEYGTATALETPPEVRTKEFERRWIKGGTNFAYAYTDLGRDERANECAANFVRQKISEIVRDPEIARKLTPVDYPIGAKRICVDTDYWETFNRSNVTLVDLRTEPIRSIDGAGVNTLNGAYPADILICATGYDAITGALLAVDITTGAGASLRREWEAGPRTYLGLAIAGFPNLFTVTGPGSPSVISNMVLSIEEHVDWIAECLTHLRRRGVRTIEASEEAQEKWVSHVREVAAGTLFYKANSWYVGANVPGKPRVFMPYVGGVGVYRQTCQEIAEAGYRGFLLDDGKPAGKQGVG